MKALIFMLVFLPLSAFAQKVDLKDLDASGGDEESTTIEISKNKKNKLLKNEAIWETADGNASIDGDEALMLKDAKANWKKACDSWKKEFRADNKENKIISMDCGTQSCTTDASGKICSSKANYKIKTKLN